MKRSIVTTVVLWVMVAGNIAMAAAIKDGQWSMTMVIGAEGMDDEMAEAQQQMENMSPEERAMMENMMGGMGMKMGGPGGGMGMTITNTQCITSDNPVPKSPDDEGCEDTHSFRGNTLHFESVCKDSRSVGKITYKNTSMNGTIETTKTVRGKVEAATINISGEYVGPCGQELSDSSSKKVKAASKKQIQGVDGSDDDSGDEPAPENTGKTKKALGGIKALMGF